MEKLSNNRIVILWVKKKMYETVVATTMEVGSETWGRRENSQRELDVMEMNYLRTMCSQYRK